MLMVAFENFLVWAFKILWVAGWNLSVTACFPGALLSTYLPEVEACAAGRWGANWTRFFSNLDVATSNVTDTSGRRTTCSVHHRVLGTSNWLLKRLFCNILSNFLLVSSFASGGKLHFMCHFVAVIQISCNLVRWTNFRFHYWLGYLR